MDPPLEVLAVPLERVLLNNLVVDRCYVVTNDDEQDDVNLMDYLGHYMGMENHVPVDYDPGDPDGMGATYFSPRFQIDMNNSQTTTFVESDDHDETHYFYEVPCPADPNNNNATIINMNGENGDRVTNMNGGYKKHKKSRKTRKSRKSRKSKNSRKSRKSRR